MRKSIPIAVAAMAMAIAIPGVASADLYQTGFEAPFTASTGQGDNVNGQLGWEMTAINGYYYDEGVVTGGISGNSLRQSNAVASGDFAGQTHSPQIGNPAGEAQSNHVFDASYTFKSETGVYQPGLAVSVSPDDGIGGRMSYVRMEDQADGIHAFVVDNPDNATQRQVESPVVYSYNQPHTVRFLMQLVPGEHNDIVRVFIDGQDIGELTHTCFTSWESWYRFGENREPPETDSLIVMARGSSQDSILGPDPLITNEWPDYADGGVAGHGYLIDDVSYETRNALGPAPTHCGDTPAFCSPGYWKNAPNAAWLKTGVAKTDRFNSVVSPTFYGPISPDNPTLEQVLGAKATKYGKKAGPFGLDPFNAVGAALTEALPGYTFSQDASIDTCPLDGRGNWKLGADPTG
jgi:hypothetical protein